MNGSSEKTSESSARSVIPSERSRAPISSRSRLRGIGERVRGACKFFIRSSIRREPPQIHRIARGVLYPRVEETRQGARHRGHDLFEVLEGQLALIELAVLQPVADDPLDQIP